MSYKDDVKQNHNVLLKILKESRPDLEILFNLIDDGQVNLAIVLNFIYLLNKINGGSGFGSITTDIQENQVTFMTGEEKLKITEPIINHDL